MGRPIKRYPHRERMDNPDSDNNNVINPDDPYTEHVLAEFFALREEQGLTMEDMEERTGISLRTLHRLEKREKGIAKKTFALMVEYVDRCTQKHEQKALSPEEALSKLEFIETRTYKLIKNAFEACLDMHADPVHGGLFTVIGHSGSGKTTALRKVLEGYAPLGREAEGQIPYVFLRAKANWNLKRMLLAIAKSLGAEPRVKTVGNISDEIIESLRERKVCVVIDEADWIQTERQLNELRTIWDESGFPCFMVGTEENLGATLTRAKRKQQLASRFGLIVRIPRVDINDIKPFIERVGLNAQEEVWRALYEASHGNLRLFLKAAEKARELSRLAPVAEEDITQIFAEMLAAA